MPAAYRLNDCCSILGNVGTIKTYRQAPIHPRLVGGDETSTPREMMSANKAIEHFLTPTSFIIYNADVADAKSSLHGELPSEVVENILRLRLF